MTTTDHHAASGMEIRTVRRFAMIHLWLLDAKVSANAVHLYATMAARHADHSDGSCWPSRSTIAEEMGVSRSTVDRAMTELVDAGAVRVTRRRTDRNEWTSSLYELAGETPFPTTDSGGVADDTAPVDKGCVTGDARYDSSSPVVEGCVTGDDQTRVIELEKKTSVARNSQHPVDNDVWPTEPATPTDQAVDLIVHRRGVTTVAATKTHPDKYLTAVRRAVHHEIERHLGHHPEHVDHPDLIADTLAPLPPNGTVHPIVPGAPRLSPVGPVGTHGGVQHGTDGVMFAPGSGPLKVFTADTVTPPDVDDRDRRREIARQARAEAAAALAESARHHPAARGRVDPEPTP